MNATMNKNNFNLSFWIKLAMTILSAFAAAMGASACGMSDVAAIATGCVAGSILNA